MKNSIESFTNVAKYSTNFLSFIKSFAESIVDINELIHSGIARDEAGLERPESIIVTEKVKSIFMNKFFKNVSYCAQQLSGILKVQRNRLSYR